MSSEIINFVVKKIVVFICKAFYSQTENWTRTRSRVYVNAA